MAIDTKWLRTSLEGQGLLALVVGAFDCERTHEIGGYLTVECVLVYKGVRPDVEIACPLLSRRLTIDNVRSGFRYQFWCHHWIRYPIGVIQMMTASGWTHPIAVVMQVVVVVVVVVHRLWGTSQSAASGASNFQCWLAECWIGACFVVIGG